jgi:hypothetical protein
MLPGFRFLFAAIVMCMSVLVFGLGATALMRAAHEDFATTASWRAPPEPRFAQQDEAAKPPVLAILSLQPRATEPAAAPKEVDTGTAAAPAPGPDTTAAVGPAAATTAPDAAQPDGAASETSSPAQVGSVAPSASPPVQIEAQPAAPTAASPPKIAATEDSKPATAATENATIGKAPPLANEPAPSAPQQSPAPAPADAPAALVLDEAATRIATLGGPPVPIADEAAKAADAKSERDAINKKLEAERAKERRRLMAARRARLEQQAAAERAANPFAPHPLIGTPPAMPAR